VVAPGLAALLGQGWCPSCNLGLNFTFPCKKIVWRKKVKSEEHFFGVLSWK
jgi:hypothetical protein